MRLPPDPARDALLGLLAVQSGLLAPDDLTDAVRGWSTALDPPPLGDWLIRRGLLDVAALTTVEALVAEHLRRHGDAPSALAALHPELSRPGCAALAAVGDPAFGPLLALVGTSPAGHDHEGGTIGVDSGRLLGCGQNLPPPLPGSGRRFRILRSHARGGIGVVYVAFDTELGREVALKQIDDRRADDPVSRARFVREAEITAGLQHPGVVPVYGIGCDGDGRPYYVMRLVHGDTLKEAIAAYHADPALHRDQGARGLALQKLLRRFLDVCLAIDYAHSRGVVHRDLKPANIVVGRYGETLVVDWGLAKPVDGGKLEEPISEPSPYPSHGWGGADTLTGSALGTPAYMSPEQASGGPDRFGPATDIYGLGATLYCVLTGRPPFAGDDVGGVLQAVRNGMFPPPRRVVHDVDPGLEAICLKAMALDPRDRYPNPRALADDVERWLAEEPVSVRPERLADRARRAMRRHRTAVTAASAALLVSFAGLAAVLAVQAKANRDLVAANRREVEVARNLRAASDRERIRFERATAALRALHTRVSHDRLLQQPAFRPLRAGLLRDAEAYYEELESLLDGETDTASRRALGALYFDGADLSAHEGRLAESLELHRKSLGLRRKLAGEPDATSSDQADLVDSLTAVGRLLGQTNHPEESLRTLSEALQRADRLSPTGANDPRCRVALVNALLGLAESLRNGEHPGSAPVFIEEALQKIGPQDDPELRHRLHALTLRLQAAPPPPPPLPLPPQPPQPPPVARELRGDPPAP